MLSDSEPPRPPPLDSQDLRAILARDVASALDAAGPSGPSSAAAPEIADPLTLRLGTGAHLLPFLAAHFAERGRGIPAVTHAGRLFQGSPAELLDGLAASGRGDIPFVEAAATALLRLAPETARASWIDRARAHPALPARLAGLEAASRLVGGGGALDTALDDPEDAVASFAAGKLASGVDTGRGLVLAAALAGRLRPECLRIAAPVLAAAGGEDLARLFRTAEAQPALREAVTEALERGRLAPEPKRELVAELFAGGDPSPVNAWLPAALGRPPGTPVRDLLRKALDDPEMPPALARAARRPGLDDEVRARAAALLPADRLTLSGSADILALAEIARPAHAPFLEASLDLVPFPERAHVAAALHRIGHPDGLAILARGLLRRDGRTVAVVLERMAEADTSPPSEVLEELLLGEDGAVRAAALAFVRARKAPLAPAVVRAGLERAAGEEASILLEALGRHPDPAAGADARSGILQALGEQGTIADPDTVARELFAGPWPAAAEVFLAGLGHPQPAVRARAAEALHRLGTPAATPAIRSLENLTRDADARVRVHAARAIGAARHDLARTALVLLARDPEPLVREEALLALGKHESFHVIPVLRQGARDDDPWVRNAARIALVQHGIADETPALMIDLDDAVLAARTQRALESAADLPHQETPDRKSLEERIRSRLDKKNR